MIADYADKLNSYEEFKGEPSRRQIRPKKRHFCLGSEIYHEVPGWCTDGIP